MSGVRHWKLLLAAFVFHLAIILGIAARETLVLIADGDTMIQAAPDGSWRKAESVVAAALGGELDPDNPLSQGLHAYTHLAGIESGYGYFAPNVPDSYDLVFELTFADGHEEHDLTLFSNNEADLRFATLLDQLGQMNSDGMREIIIKLLATSMWQQHPLANHVRAILGARILPGVDEFAAGTRESHEFMYAYEFGVERRSSSAGQ